MDIIEYADAEMMMMDLANRLAGELRQALTGGGRASLAVPGGTTPGPVFDSLCAVDMDWGRVDVMLTDERWVPEESERSNTRLLRQRLLVNHAARASYVPLYASADAPEERLDGLSQTVAATLPLSVVLLGMGADMHTASIFPGADRLAEALHGDAVLVAMRAPGAPEPRITLSAKVLRGAISRHIVITGAAKRKAIEAARHLSPEEAPVAAVLKGSIIHWAES
ncbi:MAG: 6-phosphogluconolactonase [Rhodobacterales bacterium]|nr:6-phosphogluconolactonase [Rhodobacterales bacterium]